MDIAVSRHTTGTEGRGHVRRRGALRPPRIAALLAAITLGLGPLAPPAAAQPTLGSSSQALTGEIEFAGCTSAERTKIREAMSYVVANLFVDSAFPRCLENAILSRTEGASPEAILARLREPIPTRIECKDQVCGAPEPVGCAPVDISAERLSLQKSNVANATVESIAGTILHEVAHNKGWNHPANGQFKDFNFRVPNQVGRCMTFGFSRGRLQRNLAPGETHLAPAGGAGGEPFRHVCPGATFATGGVGTASGGLRSLALDCETGATATAGGSGGTRTAKTCRADELVVGAWGTADGLLNQVGVSCAPRTQIEAGEVAWQRSHGLGGTPEGRAFERTCPPGMAVKGIAGQAGARIDQLQLVCETVGSARRDEPVDGDFVGTRTGNAGGGTCLGNGLLIGLFGRAGGEVDQLGGVCRTTTAGPFGRPVIGPDDSVHLVDGVGGDGGARFGDNCPGGHALVGVRVRAGERVNQIGGICAEPGAWSSPDTAATRTSTPLRGASTAGTLHELTCARGAYLVGFEAWARRTVHATPTVQGMAPTCRDLTLERVVARP